jgi:hypothetical protein
MDKEDFKEWFATSFGINGLASGNYTYEDFADVRTAIWAMVKSGLGFAELSSLAEIAGDITDDEDLRWVTESIEELKLDQLEKAIR